MDNKCGYIFGTVFVRFSDENTFIPDLSIEKKNKQILSQGDTIKGVPDMVVEVFSKSTHKKDLTIKKDIYEAQSDKEYWIIDPYMKAISVYLLRDGKYYLDDEYILFNAEDLELLTEEEKPTLSMKCPLIFSTV